MNAWTDDQLQQLREALEMRLTIPRVDGGTHGPVTLWHGVVADRVYVRSVRGAEAEWFRQAMTAGIGTIETSDMSSKVHLRHAPEGEVRASLDTELHRKYDRYGPNPVLALTCKSAAEATLCLWPIDHR